MQSHIEELKIILKILGNPFDIIAVTETRLHEQIPLIDISIPGYDFKHTTTKTQNGGAGIYIRSTLDCDVVKSYSVSIENICETMFVEIKNKKQKNVIFGCIYRHHTTIDSFCNEYMTSTLQKIAKSKKVFVLLGDFNINLLDYSKHSSVSNFYDSISSYGFRLLILQPTLITSRSATLIDNIFTNQLACPSNGGNIITSISDHLMQFTFLDLLDKDHTIKKNINLVETGKYSTKENLMKNYQK